VSVNIIDLLEVVQVADDQAARQSLLLVLGDKDGQDTVELGPIGKLCQRVQSRPGLEPKTLGFQGDLRRGIVYHEDCSHNYSLVVLHGDGVDIHGDLPAASSF
jgi:hypothetical protein